MSQIFTMKIYQAFTNLSQNTNNNFLIIELILSQILVSLTVQIVVIKLHYYEKISIFISERLNKLGDVHMITVTYVLYLLDVAQVLLYSVLIDKVHVVCRIHSDFRGKKFLIFTDFEDSSFSSTANTMFFLIFRDIENVCVPVKVSLYHLVLYCFF